MLVTAIMPVTRSKFALLIAVAWRYYRSGWQAAVSGTLPGLIDIGRGRKMYLECRGSAPDRRRWPASGFREIGTIAKPSARRSLPRSPSLPGLGLRPSWNADRGEAESRDPLPQQRRQRRGLRPGIALLSAPAWRGLRACRALLCGRSSGFLRAPIPRQCLVSFSSTPLPKGFGMRNA